MAWSLFEAGKIVSAAHVGKCRHQLGERGFDKDASAHLQPTTAADTSDKNQVRRPPSNLLVNTLPHLERRTRGHVCQS